MGRHRLRRYTHGNRLSYSLNSVYSTLQYIFVLYSLQAHCLMVVPQAHLSSMTTRYSWHACRIATFRTAETTLEHL